MSDLDDKKLAEWLADRIDEAESGRLIVPTHAINKYRKYIADFTSPNAVIRADIIRFVTDNGFAL